MEFDIESFRSYVLTNSESLRKTFRNPHLDEGFLVFVDSVGVIKSELLLPEIQNILTETWKYS